MTTISTRSICHNPRCQQRFNIKRIDQRHCSEGCCIHCSDCRNSRHKRLVQRRKEAS